MTEYNPSKSIKAQKEYCQKTGAPHFAPCSGICWNCRRNIYEPVEQTRTLFWIDGKPQETYITGITTSESAEKLITGCPHCNRSYCD